MNQEPTCIIKFQDGDFKRLRNVLLGDLSKEAFAVLMGKHEIADGIHFINVYDIVFAPLEGYETRSKAFLRLKKDFVHKILTDAVNRADVDAIVDVHTHPFSEKRAWFSPEDDRDETTYHKFLSDRFENLHYASIVLSQTEYSARMWYINQKTEISFRKAVMKTQTALEKIPSSDFSKDGEFEEKVGALKEQQGVQDRTVRALGLDAMRRIVDNQIISVIGVGGMGSIVAEHLVHMGFNNIRLFDHDTLEISNLNRFVGGYYQDAVEKRKKVDCVKDHLERINPDAEISAYPLDVDDPKIEALVAPSDWILLLTDTHSSRYRTQQIAFKYFIPFIAAGVNITVDDGHISDISGEVITVRMGDHYCLNCLGRLNYVKMANETHPEKAVREKLVSRGYVEGKDVKEPAVKTLNSMLSTMAVDELVNQYTGHHPHRPILVYENNRRLCIYEDLESFENNASGCFLCSM
jgi:molybdopterin/thiamine biosynthesis adenylyltransferase